jgi:hypothetical protein
LKECATNRSLSKELLQDLPQKTDLEPRRMGKGMVDKEINVWLNLSKYCILKMNMGVKKQQHIKWDRNCN